MSSGIQNCWIWLHLKIVNGGERVAVCRDAFDDRDPFPVAWLYSKCLDLLARDNHSGIIVDSFHAPLVIHAVNVVLGDPVLQERCFIQAKPLLQNGFVKRIFSRLVQSPGTMNLELFMSGQEIVDPVLAQGHHVSFGSQNLSRKRLHFSSCHWAAPTVELVHTLHHSLPFRCQSLQMLLGDLIELPPSGDAIPQGRQENISNSLAASRRLGTVPALIAAMAS
ncbi:hypothetical protein VTN31DRAFT_6067 [Thermomyces dupontii]|uniref:uncharacterized protein n=1 Tax=Talaromyces thermophilus TaxID=28565 RepID=UPI003744AC7B